MSRTAFEQACSTGSLARTIAVAWTMRVAMLLAAAAAGSALQAQQPVLPKPVQASTAAGTDGRQVSLHDQLRVGLKARTKADLAFIDLVVLRVNQGKLPRKMVDATFLWLRNRYKTHFSHHRLRPIVYFQPALTLQARKIGVVL